MYTVLIIDDDADEISLFLSAVIDQAVYKTVIAKDGKTGILLARKTNPDIILLDWMLPDIDGLDVCRQLKKDNQLSLIPIIMLSAKDAEFDKVLALEMGVDDYVSKPFGARELFSRIKTQLRRPRTNATDDQEIPEIVLQYKDICIDSNCFKVTIKGSTVQLTKTEFALLYSLAKQPDRVFTRDQLLYKIWKISSYGDTRMVDVHILRLRNKLNKFSNFNYITTVHGIGYKFSIE